MSPRTKVLHPLFLPSTAISFLVFTGWLLSCRPQGDKLTYSGLMEGTALAFSGDVTEVLRFFFLLFFLPSSLPLCHSFSLSGQSLTCRILVVYVLLHLFML